MKKIGLLLAAVLIVASTQAQQPFSGKLSEKDVEKVCNAVADWQIRNYPSVKSHDLGWRNGALYRGVAEWAVSSKQPKYFEFLKSIGERNKWDLLTQHYYHADMICVGQMYIDLYKQDGDKNKISKLLDRALTIANKPSTAPLTKDDKVGALTRWSWCDALFMAPPVYASLYTITKDKVLLDYLTNEFKECTDSLYDKQYHLFYRDAHRINLKEANGAKQFWARGCGWVFAGLPAVIDNLPAEETSHQYYIDLFKDMAIGVLNTQDKDGVWHASLLDPDSYPMPENSGCGFLCYGLAWGLRNGYLDEKTYGKATVKAWQALVKSVGATGKVGYIQPVGADPQKVDQNSTDVYGVGAFLLAGSEILRMVQ